MTERFTLPDGTEVVVHARVDCGLEGPSSSATSATVDPFDLVQKYSPDQPRDDQGRFTEIAGTIATRTVLDDGDTSSYHGKAITSGKAVSPYPERSVVIKNLERGRNERPAKVKFITAQVRSFRKNNRDLLSQPGHALGTWYDTSTGDLWLDVVRVVETADEAATLARRHNQIAYFDLDTGQEVRTGGTGLSKRLRGWFNGRGRRGAPVEDDRLVRRGDGRGDRGGAPRFDPLGLSKSAEVGRLIQSGPGLPNLSPRGEQILSIIAKRYNPNQPRDDWGRWTDTGATGERIAPHYQQPYETKTGRGGVPANFDATRMSSMTSEFLDDMERRFAEVGIDDIPGDLVDNLDSLMERIKSEHPELIEIGKEWYAEAQGRIGEHAAESGVPLDDAIGMTAAMSPNSEWGQNVALAGEMMRQLKADQPIVPTKADLAWLRKKAATPKGAVAKQLLERFRDGETPRLSDLPDDQAAWGVMLVGRRRQLVSENPTLKGTYGKVAYATGSANMAKAIAIYRGADPDDVLGGHKVRSFYNNLSDPYDSRGVGDVTIDTHAASAAQLFRMPMSSKRADLTVWTGSSGASNQQGAYPVYADAYRAVAEKHGMTANQVQAVLWIGWQQVRHEYPGIVVSEDAKVRAAGLTAVDVYGPARASTVGRYSIQVGGSGVTAPPRYASQRSAHSAYQAGQITYAEYMEVLARTPDGVIA